MMTSSSLFITAAALVGELLAPTPALATLPVALQFLTMMAGGVGMSVLMARIGRRAGFLTGLACAAAGAGLATAAILADDFLAFCLASMLLGLFNSSGQYYRFAAAEAAPESYRARAISLVLAGGVAAALIGPNLATATRTLLERPFAASFAALLVVYAVGFAAVACMRLPDVRTRTAGGEARPFSAIARQPVFVVAVVCAVVGWCAMNFVMSATPLAMRHHDHTMASTAFVIQSHVLGMFAPSFVTGHLIHRLGLMRVLWAGVVLLAGAVAVNLSGTSVTHFWIGLVFLGVGWNFLFIGGTDLLTYAYRPAERARVQAVNEFLIFGSVTAASLASGAVETGLGWAAVNLLPVPLLAAAATALLWLSRRRVTSPATVMGGSV